MAEGSRKPTGGLLSNLWVAILGLSIAGIAVYLGLGYQWLPQSPVIDPHDYALRAENLLKTTPLIDGHNDLPYLLRLELKNRINDEEKFDLNFDLASHTDMKRLKAGKIGGQFWSVFVECPDIKDLDDPNHNVRDTLEQIDVAKRLLTKYPDDFYYCETSDCVMPAFKSGRIVSMLGVEGLHQAGSAVAVIRQLFDLGVRYITITHNCDNPFATAASTVTATGEDAGLTEFGVEGIREMNRLGMMVDLAHVSHKTMHDILDITQSPVIFSHSACYALAKNYRNAPDEVIARLKENDGVLMVFFVKRFLNTDLSQKVDIDTALDHIFHIVEIAGWDHVGIGADFDGTMDLAEGIEDVSAYPQLIEAVLRRGATDAQVRKLMGENVLRVWRQNEINAEKIQKKGLKPVEAVWTGRRWSRWDNALPVMFPGNPDRIRAEHYI